jgi:photosystem II stability/assembly factor-like uncharacterized protein
MEGNHAEDSLSAMFPVRFLGGTMKTLFPIFALSLFLNVGAQDQWNAQSSGTANNLYSIQFPDRDTGYVGGAAGTILKTVNGGAAWVSKTSGTNQPLYMVFFPEKQTDSGYAVGGGGTLLKSGDKGRLGHRKQAAPNRLCASS